MNTRLIYSYMVSGHNMEYLHHLYTGALQDATRHYVFAVPRAFEQKKAFWEWPASPNITFHFLNDRTMPARPSLWANAWQNNRCLRATVRQTHADEVILLSLMDFIPFLPFFLPKGVSVSGILYKIYLYFLRDMNGWQRLSERIKYNLLSRSRCIRRIFILNDEESVAQLNRRWHTDKFRYLPDPYIPLRHSDIRDMRQETGIGSDKTIVLHIGSITHGKGSDRLFDMIDNSSASELKTFCFVFAGVVAPSIRDEFYRRVEQSRKRADIIVQDRYLSYADIGSWVHTADKVVLPYRRIGQSSGVIAYCAQLGTPAYVPRQGLIGKLVEQYRIGCTVEHFQDIHSIGQPCEVASSYCESHTIEPFCRTLLS